MSHVLYLCNCVLTETSSGDSGTASYYRNIGAAFGSYFRVRFGQRFLEYVTSLSSSLWGAIGGTEK